MRAPPASEAELLERAWAVAGRSIGEVATAQGHIVPDLTRHKGFIGELLERELGATAGSRAEPDFPGLGVELKTLPLDAQGRPQESTFVTTLPLDLLTGDWQGSRVRHKLGRVLWMPVVDLGDERRFGAPILWSPSTDEEAELAADWQTMGECVALGELWRLTGRMGKVMQLRPKGATAQEHAWVVGEDAEWARAMRRGVYLRPAFTAAIVARRVRVG